VIIIDGIIFHLQRAGGISVLFKEILRRLPRNRFTLIGYQPQPPLEIADAAYAYRRLRLLERYRAVNIPSDTKVFHSTYYRVPQSAKVRVAVTVHDFVYERFAPLVRRLVHSQQKRRAIQRADHIICVSESTKRDLVELYGAEIGSRATVIPNAASPVFRPLRSVTPRSQVLFVGARGGYKNFTSVVKAVSQIPGLTLAFVGGGPTTGAERRTLNSLLAGRYRALGFLSQEDLNLQYNVSVCLVYPSLYEGFGIPILEAMQAGCPVLAVAASSVPEVAGDSAILLPSGQPDEICSGIMSLLDGHARQALINKGLKQSTKFSWDATYQKTVEVYDNLV